MSKIERASDSLYKKKPILVQFRLYQFHNVVLSTKYNDGTKSKLLQNSLSVILRGRRNNATLVYGRLY